jgi:hypothetical protein
MEELMDLIVGGESAEASDKIKEILFAKSAERIELARPIVASSMFGINDYVEEEE